MEKREEYTKKRPAFGYVMIVDLNLYNGPSSTGTSVTLAPARGIIFTYDSRALNTQIPDGTYYIKFKLKDNLPSDLKFEYGEAIPWFNTAGNADQIRSSYKLSDLVEGTHYDVLEKLVYQNGQWIPVNQ